MDRPVEAAAAAVKATAEQALQMLQQLQMGWLWVLITRQIDPKR